MYPQDKTFKRLLSSNNKWSKILIKLRKIRLTERLIKPIGEFNN